MAGAAACFSVEELPSILGRSLADAAGGGFSVERKSIEVKGSCELGSDAIVPVCFSFCFVRSATGYLLLLARRGS